ncbi:hypothetical protein H2198_000226 [Neophaeococcomyces mojaviensis]|uniref:Uncharacterized protein n=1 Tax=Neophaeococcomyces mojaviensis TaxID=3383035 RepID=A0ACC3AKN2_9EURO|nr:hypothetical protein H2198_000226 [Knufia sp. JES_112]
MMGQPCRDIALSEHVVPCKPPSTPSDTPSDVPEDSEYYSLSSSVSSIELELPQSAQPSSLLVADIDLGSDHKLISFHNLEAYRKDCDRIQGFRHLLKNAESPVDAHYAKAFAKSNKLMTRIGEFFGSKHHSADNEVRAFWLNDGALVGGPPSEGHAQNLEGVSAFQHVEFSFLNRNSSSLISTQLIHFSCPTLKLGERLFNEAGETGYQSINIVSGVCLFNSNIMTSSCNADGKICLQDLQYPRPTFYEMEYIARASSAIADIAAFLALSPDCKIPITITLDVPSFHYFQMIDEYVSSRRCTLSEALQWISAVERRCKVVGNVFRRAVTHELTLRIGGVVNEVEIQLSEPTDAVVRKSLFVALQSQKLPDLQEILKDLDEQSDKTWERFLSVLPEKEHPKTFKDLAYTFYVFHCVRPALAMKKEAGRQLLLSIDDGAERRIYSRSQKVLKKVRQHAIDREGFVDTQLLELYLSRRVFINSNKDGSNLYLGDPTPEVLLQTHTRVISEKTDSLPAVMNVKVDLIDIISNLYGESRAQRLQEWFEEALRSQ